MKLGLPMIQKLLSNDQITAATPKPAFMMMPSGFLTGDRYQALIDASAQVSSSAVFDGAVVIGPRCRVGANVRLTDSILLEGSVVGDHGDLDRVILGPGVQA